MSCFFVRSCRYLVGYRILVPSMGKGVRGSGSGSKTTSDFSNANVQI